MSSCSTNGTSYGFFVVTRLTTTRRERTVRWTPTALIRGLLNRPRWAMWSPIPRLAGSITGTADGLRPDLPRYRRPPSP